MAILAFATSLADLKYAVAPTAASGSDLAGRIAPYVAEAIQLGGVNDLGIELDFPNTTDFWLSFYAYFDNGGSVRPMFVLSDDAHEQVRLDMDGSTLGGMEYNTRTDPNLSPIWTEPQPGITVLASDILFRFDVHVVLSATTGLIELYRDKSLLSSFSGQTSFGGNAFSNRVKFFNVENSSSQNAYFSAIMVADEDTRPIEYVQPTLTADGTVTGFTGGFADVEGVGIDDTDRLVASAAASATFDKSAIPAALGTGYDVAAVGVSARAQSGVSAPSNGQLLVNSNGTEGASPNKTLTPLSKGVQHVFSTNPDTGAAWTIAEADAAEVGVKVL